MERYSTKYGNITSNDGKTFILEKHFDNLLRLFKDESKIILACAKLHFFIRGTEVSMKNLNKEFPWTLTIHLQYRD